MRFFKSFRLLHRRTKSDGDVATVVARESICQTSHDSLNTGLQNLLHSTIENSSLYIDAANFVPAQPFFDPVDLYVSSPATSSRLVEPAVHYNVLDLEAELATLRGVNQTLKADLVEVIKEASDARTALYTEMSTNASQKRQISIASHRIQDFTVAFARYEAIDGLLARIGLHKAVLDEALAAQEAGGDAEEVIVNAMTQSKNKTRGTLFAIAGPRYVASLNMTLQVRKELKGRRKITKFWKRAAQQDGKHKETITPSPSDISSIHEPLSPERQKAVDELIVRRRENAGRSPVASESTSSVNDATILAAYQMAIQKVPTDSDTGSSNFISVSASTSISASTAHAEVVTSLPPLASESIKFELAQHSVGKRFSSTKRQSQPSVLRQIDLNASTPSITPKRTAQSHILEYRRSAPVSS